MIGTQRAAVVQAVLEGIPLPATKSELLAYARMQEPDVTGDLAGLPDERFSRLDQVGELLTPAPARATEDAPLPRPESGKPPGGDDYTTPKPGDTGPQRRGIGTEMRAAVLHLAFAGLGADWAVSSAATDNPASVGVSRKLGYADDGIQLEVVRGQRRTELRFRLDRQTWAARQTVPVQIDGLEPCLELLGAVNPAAAGATASTGPGR